MSEKIFHNPENQSKLITEAEQRVLDVEDTMAGLEARLAEAEKKIKVMADGIDHTENRNRQDNIHVLNLKESTEGKRPIDFFESWPPTVLQLEADPGTRSELRTTKCAPWPGDYPSPQLQG